MACRIGENLPRRRALRLREVQYLLKVTARKRKRWIPLSQSSLEVNRWYHITSVWAALSTTLLGALTKSPIMECFDPTVYHIQIWHLHFHLKMYSHIILLQFRGRVYLVITTRAIQELLYVTPSHLSCTWTPQEASDLITVAGPVESFSVMTLPSAPFTLSVLTSFLSLDVLLTTSLLYRLAHYLTSFEDPCMSVHWVNTVCWWSPYFYLPPGNKFDASAPHILQSLAHPHIQDMVSSDYTMMPSASFLQVTQPSWTGLYALQLHYHHPPHLMNSCSPFPSLLLQAFM